MYIYVYLYLGRFCFCARLSVLHSPLLSLLFLLLLSYSSSRISRFSILVLALQSAKPSIYIQEEPPNSKTTDVLTTIASNGIPTPSSAAKAAKKRLGDSCKQVVKAKLAPC